MKTSEHFVEFLILVTKLFLEKLYKCIPPSLAVVLDAGCDFAPKGAFCNV